MSEECFAVVNASGDVIWTDRGRAGDAALQVLEPGLRAIVVPREALLYKPINPEVVRAFYRRAVDEAAGAFRARFITDVPGQAQTYEKKEAEARAWTAGDEVANPGRYPFMVAEAAARNVPVAQVQGEIMAQVNALIPLAAAIEGHRIAVKAAVSAAATLPEIADAAAFDWESLLP